jgi:putative transposase
MILTYRYRLMPNKRQHHQLYNAALEERIDAYRKAGVRRTYFDQTQALTEWRKQDPEGRALPANFQRATLKRLDEAYKAFFRRVKLGGKPGFPRFRGKGWFDSASSQGSCVWRPCERRPRCFVGTVHLDARVQG